MLGSHDRSGSVRCGGWDGWLVGWLGRPAVSPEKNIRYVAPCTLVDDVLVELLLFLDTRHPNQLPYTAPSLSCSPRNIRQKGAVRCPCSMRTGGRRPSRAVPVLDSSLPLPCPCRTLPYPATCTQVDDTLAELFLSEAPVDGPTLAAAIRRATLGLAFQPVFMGSAFKNRGGWGRGTEFMVQLHEPV